MLEVVVELESADDVEVIVVEDDVVVEDNLVIEDDVEVEDDVVLVTNGHLPGSLLFICRLL